jgi:hypothetical protein
MRRGIGDEAYRIRLLNHLVRASSCGRGQWTLACQIAANNRASVIGMKALLPK